MILGSRRTVALLLVMAAGALMLKENVNAGLAVFFIGFVGGGASLLHEVIAGTETKNDPIAVTGFVLFFVFVLYLVLL